MQSGSDFFGLVRCGISHHLRMRAVGKSHRKFHFQHENSVIASRASGDVVAHQNLPQMVHIGLVSTVDSLKALETPHETVKSIAAWGWITSALSIQN